MVYFYLVHQIMIYLYFYFLLLYYFYFYLYIFFNVFFPNSTLNFSFCFPVKSLIFSFCSLESIISFIILDFPLNNPTICLFKKDFILSFVFCLLRKCRSSTIKTGLFFFKFFLICLGVFSSFFKLASIIDFNE